MTGSVSAAGIFITSETEVRQKENGFLGVLRASVVNPPFCH